MIKILIVTLFFILFLNISGEEHEEKRVSDPRINGFRKDYKPKKNGKINFNKRLRKESNYGIKYSGKRFTWEEKIDMDTVPLSIEELLKGYEFPPEPEPSEDHDKILKSEKKGDSKAPLQIVPEKKSLRKTGYTGDMKNNLRHGNGTLNLENGDRYTGHWSKGKKHGHGIYIYSTGIKYSGQWEEDKMHGQGSLMFPDGSLFMGEMKENEITGFGTFKYADGSVYRGWWKNGTWNGEGEYTLTDGRTLHALFAENQIVELIENSSDEDTVLKDNEMNDIDGR